MTSNVETDVIVVNLAPFGLTERKLGIEKVKRAAEEIRRHFPGLGQLQPSVYCEPVNHDRRIAQTALELSRRVGGAQPVRDCRLSNGLPEVMLGQLVELASGVRGQLVVVTTDATIRELLRLCEAPMPEEVMAADVFRFRLQLEPETALRFVGGMPREVVPARDREKQRAKPPWRS